MLVDFQSPCEASGSVQTLVLIILNYFKFFQKSLTDSLIGRLTLIDREVDWV